MRWLVEVTSIGKNDRETFCVEAESWQRALQQTRVLRKETAPMSGFSIELLDEGCRAVDPMSRLRYEVKRTRDDAPLTAGAQAAAATVAAKSPLSAPPPAPVAPVSASVPVPRPASNPPPAMKRPVVGKTTAFMGSGGGQMQQAVEPPKAAPPAPPVVAPAPLPPAAPAAPPPAPVAAPPPPSGAPSSQIIFKREQDPTEAVPLAYREYVFVVAQGTTEAIAEAVLRSQLDQVRASIAALPPGKLVQLAVFDVMFRGRPPVRPLATLVWKDWREAPFIGFPRRPDYAPPAAFIAPAPVAPPVQYAPPPVQYAPPPPVQYAPPPPVQYAPPPPVPYAPPQAPPAHFPIPTPQGPNDTQPLAAIVEPPTPIVPAAPAPPVAARPPAPQPDFSRTYAEQRPPSAPMRSVRPNRMRGDELIADLFEAMHDLHFVRDAVDGAAFCLALALEKLPAQLGIVHLYDIDRREFVVTSTRGDGAHVLLLARYPESEPLLSAAMRKRRAIVIGDATQSDAPPESLGRFAAIGAVRSMVIAPVQQSGRFLGAIEIVNPTDGSPFTDDEGNALNYIAEQLGEFVANVGVVTDPERITAAAAQPVRR